MTVAIGMVCQDGIVLASDTRYRTEGRHQKGDKIYPLSARPWLRAIVAGAGTVGFIKAAAQKVESALPLRQTSLTGVIAAVEAANKRFYEDYAELSRGSDYALLVGLAHNSDGLALLHTTENSTRQVEEIQTEGTGGVVAEPYTNLWREEMPAFEAELAAIFMVKCAKTYDSDNCGGETKVFTLLGQDTLLTLEERYIELGEKYFEDFNALSHQMLLPSETGEFDELVFRADLRERVESLQHYRDELNRYHQRAYRRVP